MKAVFILGALALVLVCVSGQRSGEEEESQLTLSEGNLQREARAADPRRKKKKTKKNNGKKQKGSGRRKEKKAAKKNGKGMKDRRKRRKGKNGSKTKNGKPQKNGAKRRGGKPAARKCANARQSEEACLSDLVTAIKGYRAAGNQKRMAMRITAWKKNMGKKKDKASTQFSDAADSLDAATGGGKTCGSGAPDSDTTDALAKLKNCSVTAAALCDDSAVNDTGAEDCKTKFEAYIKAFDACVTTPSCDCFKALTPVESSCSFKAANDAAKASKDKCFKSDTPGSFGDCSKSLKESSGKIGKCGLGVGTGPVGPTTKSARNLRNRIAFRKF